MEAKTDLEKEVVEYFNFGNLKFMERLYKEHIPNKEEKISLNYLSRFPELFLYAYKTRTNLPWDEFFEMVNSNRTTYSDITKKTFAQGIPQFDSKFLKRMGQLVKEAHLSLNRQKITSYLLGKQFIGDYQEIDNPYEHFLNKIKEINLITNPSEEPGLKVYQVFNEKYAVQISPTNAFFEMESKRISAR